MTKFLLAFLTVFGLLFINPLSLAAQSHELTIQDTHFLLDGQPFPFTGLSFFNAVYNLAFNKSSADRKAWLAKFKRYGINVLRVWAQWDNDRGFVDSSPTTTFYNPDGSLRMEHVNRLKAILRDADELGMVIELVLFSQESYYANIRLGGPEADRAVAAIIRELLPHRNLVIQIWNELSDRVIEHVKMVKSIDPKRLVTNSPGFAGVLGDEKQNSILDFLTPHTSRQGAGRHWEIAPYEIAYLLKRYHKPVVDDEPARNGTPKYGGPKETPHPQDQILQIYQVWQLGGYIIYTTTCFRPATTLWPYRPPAFPIPNSVRTINWCWITLPSANDI